MGPEYAPELRLLCERARPLRLFPLIDVDTAQPIDVRPFLPLIEQALQSPDSAWSSDGARSRDAAPEVALIAVSSGPKETT